jgi:hypothetical protein
MINKHIKYSIDNDGRSCYWDVADSPVNIMNEANYGRVLFDYKPSHSMMS